MCWMQRFYCYRLGLTMVEDAPLDEAAVVKQRLLSEGWTIYDSVFI